MHAPWTPRVEGLALSLIRETLDVPEDEPTTPFVSIHAMHGDFKTYCDAGNTVGCFASIDIYRTAMDEAKVELSEMKGQC